MTFPEQFQVFLETELLMPQPQPSHQYLEPEMEPLMHQLQPFLLYQEPEMERQMHRHQPFLLYQVPEMELRMPHHYLRSLAFQEPKMRTILKVNNTQQNHLRQVQQRLRLQQAFQF